MSERDNIWIELYNSPELRRAAKNLIPHSELHEDLLSDAIITVFDKRLDFIDLHKNGNLRGYVYVTMCSMVRTRSQRDRGQAWARHDRWAQQYGLAESNIGEFVYREKDDNEYSEAEVITEEELKYSSELFGNVTGLGVKLMRMIDEVESGKESDPDLWEAAQFTKLYLQFGSLKKVSDATGTKKNQVKIYVDKFKEIVREKERMKISVVTKGDEPLSGMELYRLYYPYFNGVAVNHSDEFEVKQVTYEYLSRQSSLESDVYVFSRIQKHEKPLAEKVLSEGKKMVLDVDDYWNLHSDHPLRQSPQNVEYVSTITDMMQKAHVVTTTSDLLAERMNKELSVTAHVIKNTIPEDAQQFKGEKYYSSLTRIGWIGGTHHANDLELLRPSIKKLYGAHDLLGKIQICLAGFNPNYQFIHYESIMTCDNYGIRTDEDYINYLKQNTNMLSHLMNNKPYRRIWARPVTEYGQGYREVDIVWIPLVGGNLFNSCKSELKLIEAGTTSTPAIVSDVAPYSPHLHDGENCLKVSPKRQDWYVKTRQLVNDVDARAELGANLNEYVKKNFNHKTETKKLVNVLKKLK